MTGLCIPMLEWRRFGLYQHSIHSKMADGKFFAGLPRSSVEQLQLQGSPERFHHGVVVAVADGAHRAEKAGDLQALPERPRRVLGAVIGVQDRRSARRTLSGWRRTIAMPSASVTSSVRMWSAIDQPTISRE